MNKFEPLTKAPGFRKVLLLGDGGVSFERHFFFRWVKATISPEMHYTSYEAHLNSVNCILCLFCFFAPMMIIIFLTGLKTKEHLLEDIQLIIDKPVSRNR